MPPIFKISLATTTFFYCFISLVSHALFEIVSRHFPKRNQETGAKNNKLYHTLVQMEDMMKLQKSLKDKET